MQTTLQTVVDSLRAVPDTVRIQLFQQHSGDSIRDWLTVAIAIIAVIVGPAVTLWLGRRQLKATVLSTNRQQWIHILRDQLSELNSIATVVIWHLKQGTADDKEFPERVGRAFFLESKIKLLLNPDKPLQKTLLNEVENVTGLISKKTDLDKFQAALEKMNNAGVALFRETWVKVKDLK